MNKIILKIYSSPVMKKLWIIKNYLTELNICRVYRSFYWKIFLKQQPGIQIPKTFCRLGFFRRNDKSDIKIKQFDGYSIEWAEFILLNRKGSYWLIFTQYAINSKRCKFPSTFAPFTQIKTIFAFQNPERRKKWSK